MYAVMGITGQVGSAIADTLLTAGSSVRAIVRDPAKASSWRDRGAEIAVAEYTDAAALESAFRGTEGVFLMLPPNFAPAEGFPEARAVVAAIRQALSAARPPRFAALSSVGAQQTSGTGLITTAHILEQELGSLGIPAAFLRAGWFMENSLWDIPPAREMGKLFAYVQPLDRAIPMVATRDIGRVGAGVLLEPWTGIRHIEVAGPADYTPLDLAHAFSRALGKPVEAVPVPRATWQSTFVAQGMPADRTQNRIEMLDALNSGHIAFGVPGTERRTGTITLEDGIARLVADHPAG